MMISAFMGNSFSLTDFLSASALRPVFLNKIFIAALSGFSCGFVDKCFEMSQIFTVLLTNRLLAFVATYHEHKPFQLQVTSPQVSVLSRLESARYPLKS